MLERKRLLQVALQMQRQLILSTTATAVTMITTAVTVTNYLLPRLPLILLTTYYLSLSTYYLPPLPTTDYLLPTTY